MQIKEVLSTVDCLSKMHYTPDGYLAYGEFQDDKFYAIKKDLNLGHYGFEQESFYDNVEAARAVRRQHECYMCIWYAPVANGIESGAIAYVFPRNRNMYGSFIEDLTPTGYYFVGITVQAGDSIIDLNKFNQLASTLVAFNKGPNDSVIPVMWRVDKPYGVVDTYEVFLKDTKLLFDRKVFMDAVSQIKKDLPPVDLETESEKRYVTIEIDDGVYYMYNRNHVAYNGAASSYEEFASVLFWVMANFYDSIGYENLTDYITADFDDEHIEIVGIGAERKENVEERPVGEFMNPPEVKPEKEYKHEDNILLRAARASDTDYK